MRENEVERDRRLEVLRARYEAEQKKQHDMDKKIMKSKVKFQEELLQDLKSRTELNEKMQREQKMKQMEEEKRRLEEVRL